MSENVKGLRDLNTHSFPGELNRLGCHEEI